MNEQICFKAWKTRKRKGEKYIVERAQGAIRENGECEGETMALCEVELTKGKFAIIEASDMEIVLKYSWHATCHRRVYAASCFPLTNEFIYLHQLLCQHDSLLKDHRNGNGLDNRRSNLRATSNQINAHNAFKFSRPCSSDFRGVCWDKNRGKWLAQAQIGKRRFRKRFSDEKSAALWCDELKIKMLSESVRLNFQ